MNALKNRITAHVKLPASALKPHPLNPRTHPDEQRSVLRGLLEEIGLARSVLAYVADADKQSNPAQLTLIDGHLRQEELGDAEVDVEVLDVNDEEARALLLAIDPLAQLAGFNAETVATLRETVEQHSPAVASLWAHVEEAAQTTKRSLDAARRKIEQRAVPENFLIIVTCSNEQEQVTLLKKFRKEGYECEAKIS